MKRALALASFVCIAGCATPAADNPPLRPGEVLSANAANDSLSIGKSTKADVRAALGEPVAVDFATGYEVWVYRERAAPARTTVAPAKAGAHVPEKELVLLFAPSGALAKSRIR